MAWHHKSNSDTRVLKTKLKKPKERNILEQKDSVKIHYSLVFFLLQNKYGRVLTLTLLLAISSLAFYYSAMDVPVASRVRKNDVDIYIPTTYLTAKPSTTKPSVTTKGLKSDPSTIPSTHRTKFIPLKSASSIRNPQVKSTSKMPLSKYRRATSRVSSASTPRSSNPTSDTNCRMFSCFNYSRCPITGRFPVYLYNLNELYNGIEGITVPIKEMLSVNNYITSDSNEACIFIVIAELPYAGHQGNVRMVLIKLRRLVQSYKMINEATLNTLPYWGSDGQNHLLLNLGYGTFTKTTGSAIVAQNMFKHDQFRPGFDVVIPASQGAIPMKGEIWSLSKPMGLAKRKILISFQGQRLLGKTPTAERDKLVKILQDIRFNHSHVRLQFHCKRVNKLPDNGIDDWLLCKNHESGKIILQKSTFVLIIAPSDYSYASTNLLQIRLYEALEAGAIPVILGGDRIRLPFEEVLDWRKAVISLPTARITDLPYLLESITDEDILEFRKHGHMLWERYLGTVQASVDSLLAVIRTRLNIAPQLPKFEYISKFEFYLPEVAHGNRLPGISSNIFKRNFTVGLLNAYEQWNLWGDPFVLHPQLPWDPKLTPEARFLNASAAIRFHESCRAQAGDMPVEQFTVVILTFNRPLMLDQLIIRVSQLRYLNKILVVCNGPSKPTRDNWPTTIPVVVVHAFQNSINNRFVPYDMIETEAVLSLDDDVIPSSKDIKFAFKVWRQHRDQIVGFLGRNVIFDYGKNIRAFRYSTPDEKGRFCEVRMVLTGAAFIHRYYFWAYWRILPQAVRKFVDKHRNCEDIAMNFLVAHIAKKPPIKVKSDWAEQTDGSYSKLSLNSSHYANRNKCMKFFAKVMGYTPLLTTHYRVKPLEKHLADIFQAYHSTIGKNSDHGTSAPKTGSRKLRIQRDDKPTTANP